jgi:DNA-binding SARP family transcriptional activator
VSLSIALLGVPQLALSGQPVEGLRRKNRALVYYLAAHAQPLARDQLLALFWPDHERSAAQAILRTMVHALRRRLGPSFQSEDDRLGFTPETVIDSRQFASALAPATPEPARLVEALRLYRGPFLEGFELADTPAFEDWAAAQRERCQALALRGYSALANQYAAAGDVAQALEVLETALVLDPLQEELQRAALRLHYRAGDRAGAIRRYQALRQRLLDELGVPPMPETRRVYDAIITDQLAGPAPHTARPLGPPPAQTMSIDPAGADAALRLPLIGRQAELQTLASLADEHKLLVIEGEPGIGKTRLADEFLAWLGPGLILRGIAHEQEQGLPYQPWLDALRGLLNSSVWETLRSRLALDSAWLAELARLLPELQAQWPALPAAPPLLHEARLWEAFHQLLQALARLGPVTVCLDDMQWADASTVGWLGYMARRLAEPAPLLLITARPVDAHAPLAQLLQALAHEQRVTRLPLGPLSTDDLRALAQQLSAAHAEPLGNWLAQTAEGNPYFLTELIRYAYRSGFLSGQDSFDRAMLASLPVLPPTIRNLIQSRLLRLSEAARGLLSAAAVVGREFEFELVSQAAALPEAPALDALDELRAAGLVHAAGGGRFTFDHSLTLQAAAVEMTEVRRQHLHRRVAETLLALHGQQLDSAAGSIAQHFSAGGRPARAAPYAARAGHFAASVAAWSEAIHFFETALSLALAEAERPALLLAMGNARFHAGQFGPASVTLRQAGDLALAQDNLAAAEAAYLAFSQSLMPQARYAEAIALGRELSASGPPELAPCAEFIWGTGLALESAHPLEAERHLRAAERGLRARPGGRGRLTLAQVQYQLAGTLGQQGQGEAAVALYQSALAFQRADPAALDLLRHIMLYNNLAYQLNLLGDPAAAEYARAGIRVAQEAGSLTHVPYLLSTSGEIALAANDLATAEACFAEGLALARQVPIAERVAGLTANLARVAAARGEHARARALLQEAQQAADALGAQHLAVRVRLWLAPLLPLAEARGCLAEARTLAEASGFERLLQDVERLEAGL